MRIALVISVIGLLSADARADVFAFKDLEGYEACLRTDHVVERVDTPKGSQTRFLSETEVQIKCVEAAVRLLAGAKDKGRVLDFIKATKRLTAPVNAIELVGVLASASLPACNELAGYEVMIAALSMPAERAYVSKARNVVKRCLKDATFRQDFLEEKDSSDAYLSANACAILLEEKLVKSCKGSK